MTNQEASKVIKDGLEDMSLDFADEEQYEALTMAIKVLKQEPYLKKCAVQEDDCEEWAGCPCMYYEADKEDKE